MRLGALGQAFDPLNMAFNSGGQRGMTWGQYIGTMQASLQADLALIPSGNAFYYPGQPEANVIGFLIVNDNGTIRQINNPYLGTPDANNISQITDFATGESWSYPGNAVSITLNGGSPGFVTWQFLSMLSQFGISSFPASIAASPSAFVSWISANPSILKWFEGGYVTLNNSPTDSPDMGSLLVMGAVAAFAALAIYTAAAATAASSASAAPTSAVSATPTSAVTAAPTSAASTGEATAASTGVTSAPVETATITPVSSADVSTLTAEGFPTSAIASPLTTGAGSAVSAAAQAATSSPTSLLTSGAGLVQQAAPAIAAGTALVKKIFGAQTSPVAPGAYIPAQRRINPLFIGAGILLLAVVVKKGGGKKGKHHEPRTDFVR